MLPPDYPRPLPMQPGTYLNLRRRMARVSLASLARNLACLERFTGQVTPEALRRLELRLWHAENADGHLEPAQIDMVRNYVRLDPHIYRQLVDLREAMLARQPIEDLPQPMVCTSCACSFHDPCKHSNGLACAWTAEEPLRCTACATTDHALDRDSVFDPSGPLVIFAAAAGRAFGHEEAPGGPN